MQFHELRDVLKKDHDAVVSRIPFPGKVFFGNLAKEVVQQRKQQLLAFIEACLACEQLSESQELLSFLEADGGSGWRVGTAYPNTHHRDMYERDFDSQSYGADHVLVYSAASRYNFQSMTRLVSHAQKHIMQTYPELKVVFVSYADLRIVPHGLRQQALSILKGIDANAIARYMENYTGNLLAAELYCIPMWTAAELRQYGYADANWTYHVTIVADGMVRAHLQSSTRDAEAAYVRAIDGIVADLPHLTARWPESSLPRLDCDDDIRGCCVLDVKRGHKLSGNGRLSVEFRIPAPNTRIGWQFQSTSDALYLQLIRRREPGEPARERSPADVANASDTAPCDEYASPAAPPAITEPDAGAAAAGGVPLDEGADADSSAEMDASDELLLPWRKYPCRRITMCGQCRLCLPGRYVFTLKTGKSRLFGGATVHLRLFREAT